MTDLKIFFDGDCFFCSTFMSLTKLKSQGNVELVSLRENKVEAMRLMESGIDIDNSFVLEIDGRYLLKNDAMAFLLKRMDRQNLARLFEVQGLGVALYSVLAFLRRIYIIVTRKGLLQQDV